MLTIDDKQVILGGLAAGLVLFAGSLTLGRIAGTEIVVAIAGDTTLAIDSMETWGYAWAHLLIGTVMAWVYAVLRPFYGTGARAAVRAGLAVWVIAMPAPMAFQVVLHVERPGLEGGSMLAAMAVSAALFALAGLASAGARNALAMPAAAPDPVTEGS